MKASKVIENVNGLIEGQYFENENNPRGCRACAVGALVQAMPTEKFAKAINYYENDNDIDHNSTMSDLVSKYYRLTPKQLKDVQEINDGWWNESSLSKYGAKISDSRKTRVLKYLKSIGR
jgi:hypothetical protein